ncbi:hypothetical protein HAX54_011897, partial [Datura stramonium]|nr:hypothetical protein [Datura stramonium]
MAVGKALPRRPCQCRVAPAIAQAGGCFALVIVLGKVGCARPIAREKGLLRVCPCPNIESPRACPCDIATAAPRLALRQCATASRN